MGYYHIELPPISKQLCTIVLMWVNYELQKLPMLLCNTPYIFQENISKLFEGFDMAFTYTGYVLVINKNNFADHLKALEIFL